MTLLRRRDLLIQAAQTSALLTALPAAAQDAAPAKPPASLLRQLVPQPSGRNGYEELLAAVDALRSSRYREQSQLPNLTLETKRSILADRQIIRALALLRQGLEKPITSPRAELTASTLLPELSEFRGLARLLALQQYVYLSEGRTADALTNAWLGLRFGRAIQFDTLIAGLVGVAMGSVCLTPLSKHLDQLSTKDCTALHQLCLEWLAQPNPQEKLLMSEFRFVKGSMGTLRDETLRTGVPQGKELGLRPEDQALFNQLPKSPNEINAFYDGVNKRLDEEFQRVFEQLRRAPWQRTKLQAEKKDDLAGQLTQLLLPAYDRVDTAYIREATRVRLLACHAAIRRFRWEYDRLPENLAEVRLEELAVDPFTGNPFRYQTKASRYSLVSVGPAAEQEDDPRAVEGHIPVSITPDD